jgi:putative glutamine amidotransferase
MTRSVSLARSAAVPLILREHPAGWEGRGRPAPDERAARQLIDPGEVRPARAPARPDPTMGLQLVSARGCAAQIALPEGVSLARWAQAVIRDNIFPDHRGALVRLTKTAPEIRRIDDDDPRPRVGIIVNDPSDLLAGSSSDGALFASLVREMGCHPILIPPCADAALPWSRRAVIGALLAPLDGLLGPGGPDVDPKIYHARNRWSVRTSYVRDRFEAAFVLAALDHPMFLFGICRSHQLWNAITGGEISQDLLRDELATVSHRRAKKLILEDHVVEFARRSHMRREAGVSSLATNTSHHQAVKKAGRRLVAIGWVRDPSSGRRMIEATEGWNVRTTQFHPETMRDDRIARRLLYVLGRRAAIFRLLKRMDPARVSEASLAAAMRRDDRFELADYAWVREELAPRLTQIAGVKRAASSAIARS